MSKKQKKQGPTIISLQGVDCIEKVVPLADYEKMKRRAASFKGLNKRLAIHVNTLETSLRHYQGESFNLKNQVNAARTNIETKTIQMRDNAHEIKKLKHELEVFNQKVSRQMAEIARLKEAIVNQALNAPKPQPLKLGY